MHEKIPFTEFSCKTTLFLELGCYLTEKLQNDIRAPQMKIN